MINISVVVPAFNADKTILRTVKSVLNQTFIDFELIIVDDGSQDSTSNIISQVKDSRIKLFSYPNAGANVSRNRGIFHASGEYITFLDADDIWTNDKLISQFEALQANSKASVAYSWTDYIDADDNFVVSGTHATKNGDVYNDLLISNFLENGSNPLIRKEALIELGGFDESLKAAQDWDMWLRLADKYEFVAVPKVQILYRISENSTSSNLDRQEKACLTVMNRAYQARQSIKKEALNASFANLYKYLTCRALLMPYSRKKAFTAAKFLHKYFIYDKDRLQRLKFVLTLWLKIIIIVLLPKEVYNKLFTSLKVQKNQLKAV
jgi:glycosyltransferase involved in cell wall biosynthesis